MQVTNERNKQMRAKAHKRLDELIDEATHRGVIGLYAIRLHVNEGTIAKLGIEKTRTENGETCE